MPFQYRKVLLIGATSGIGEALADRFVAEGSHVIAVGRRQERLDEFVEKHGKDKASGITFDIADLGKIRDFANAFVPSIYSANTTCG
jgi:NADP-dependent 3-hydroxy acid dehydrogenase YdfG